LAVTAAKAGIRGGFCGTPEGNALIQIVALKLHDYLAEGGFPVLDAQTHETV